MTAGAPGVPSVLGRYVAGPWVRWMERLPFRVRITVLFTAITGLTLLFFSGLLYRAFVRNQQAEFDAALYNHAIDISQTVGFDFFGNLALENIRLSESEKIFPFAPGKALLQIRRSDGAVLARSRSSNKIELPWAQPGFTQVNVGGTNHRLLTYQVDRGPGLDLMLQIAVPMTFLERERLGLLAFIAIAIPSVLVLAAFGGLWLSRRALAPVRAITATARDIRTKTLASRVPVPRARDEHRQLAETLNDLLSRLQRAFESQEQFIANASHQLRTPLAILRGELDVVRSRPRSEGEMRDFLSSASQEIDYLTRIVEDLLVLARTDSGFAEISMRGARLDEILLEVTARLAPLAKSREIQLVPNVFLAPSSEPVVNGEPELLQSLLRNLIENALKYSPVGTRVDVQLTEESPGEAAADGQSGGELVVSVLDQGPGIPSEQLSKIFERFQRGDAGQAAGSGLGLSIASKIADLHGAKLTAQNLPSGSGSVFRLRIKKA